MRFSLKSLLLAVLIVSICCAALASRSFYGSTAFSQAFEVLLLTSIIAAVYCSKQTRAFWLGFGVFGWGAWAMELQPIRSLLFRDGFRLYNNFIETVEPKGARGPVPPSAQRYEHFRETLGSTEMLLLAFLGGLLAIWLYRRREKARKAEH